MTKLKADSFTFPGTDMTVNRMGYGAMQLAGPHVFGPPKDRAECVAVLREAIESGVDHIDTSDFYGPHVTNQIIKEAIYPYPEGWVIVTKVGARRDANGGWPQARTPKELTEGVHDNLRNLGLERLDVVNLRMGGLAEPVAGSIAEQVEALVKLKEQGLIREIGLSTVNSAQYAEAKAMTNIVCIQNLYNVAQRQDEAFLHELAADGVAYVPYFPLGGFTPLQSHKLDDAAKEVGATPMQVALAWLLQRSPNMLLIPGTSSRGHLRENLAAASIELPAKVVEELDSIDA